MDNHSLRTKIKEKLEQVECPIHHEYPNVTITDRGISIKGCCEELQRQTAEYARIVAKEIRDEIEDQLGSIFR